MYDPLTLGMAAASLTIIGKTLQKKVDRLELVSKARRLAEELRETAGEEVVIQEALELDTIANHQEYAADSFKKSDPESAKRFSKAIHRRLTLGTRYRDKAIERGVTCPVCGVPIVTPNQVAHISRTIKNG